MSLLTYKRGELTLIVLVFFGGLISYLDRAIFGLLAPKIQHDLGLSSIELGFTFSIFSVGYMSSVLLGGYLADRFGPKRVIAVSAAMWMIFCASTGLARNLATMLGARFLFGVGEAPWVPSWHKLFYRWFSSGRYTSAAGIATSGLAVGGAIAGPLAASLELVLGWRLTFGVIGLSGMLWFVAWVLLVRESPPEQHRLQDNARPAVDQASNGATVQRADDAPSRKTLMRAIFNVSILSIIVAQAAFGYILYFFISWFPSYLAQTLQLNSIGEAAANAAPWIGGIFGLLCGGFATDMLIRRLADPVLARKIMILVGLGVAALSCILIAFTSSANVAVSLMVLTVFFMFFSSPNYSALVMDLTRREHHGVANGMMVLATSVGGIVSPIVTGAIVQTTGSFSQAFVVTSLVLFAGAVAIMLCPNGRKLEPATI